MVNDWNTSLEPIRSPSEGENNTDANMANQQNQPVQAQNKAPKTFVDPWDPKSVGREATQKEENSGFTDPWADTAQDSMPKSLHERLSAPGQKVPGTGGTDPTQLKAFGENAALGLQKAGTALARNTLPSQDQYASMLGPIAMKQAYGDKGLPSDAEIDKNIAQKGQQLDQKYKDYPITSKAGALVGEYGPAMLAPGGKVKAGGSIIKNAVTRLVNGTTRTGAVMAGTQYEPGGTSLGQRLLTTSMGGAFGVLGPMLAKSALPIAGGAVGGYQAAKTVNTGKDADSPLVKYGKILAGIAGGAAVGYGVKRGGQLAINKLSRGSKPSVALLNKELQKRTRIDANSAAKQERIRQAGKRLGSEFETTGERTGSASIKKSEALMNPTDKGIAEAGKKLSQREAQIKAQLKENVQSVLPKGSTPKQVQNQVNEGYIALKKGNISPEVQKVIAKDKDLQKFIKMAEKDPNYSASMYGKTQVGKLIETEKFLKARGGPEASAKAKELQKILDSTLPDYSKLRALAQKNQIYKKRMEALSKLKNEPGQDLPTVDVIHNKFFGSEAAKKEFLRDTIQAGGNVQQAKDLIRYISALRDSGFNKVPGKVYQLTSKFGDAQGPSGMFTGGVSKFFKGEIADQQVKALTNPKYLQDLEKAIKAGKGPELDSAIAKFLPKLGTVSGSAAITPNKKVSVPQVQNTNAVVTDKEPKSNQPSTSTISKPKPESVVSKPEAPTQIYKYTDADGNVSFSDEKKPGAVPYKPTKPIQIIKSTMPEGKAKKIAENIALMPKKEFHNKLLNTLKGRQELIQVASKYGEPGDVELLKKVFNAMDRGQDLSKVVGPEITSFNNINQAIRNKIAQLASPQKKGVLKGGKMDQKKAPHKGSAPRPRAATRRRAKMMGLAKGLGVSVGGSRQDKSKAAKSKPDYLQAFLLSMLVRKSKTTKAMFERMIAQA